MATFKVGQRVRINAPGLSQHGKEGTIWLILPSGVWSDAAIRNGCCGTVYRVDLDGVGRKWPKSKRWIGFPSWELQPLTDPGVDQMIERLTRPVPFIQQLKDTATIRRKVHNEGEKA